MTETIFEKCGGTYVKVGDYYVPNLGQFDEAEIENVAITKYGMMRETYLKEHRETLYNHLLLKCELHSHLRDVEEQSQLLIDKLLPQYKAKQGVTEELKSKDQLLWVGKMNNIMAQIEEIIFEEIIYV